MRRMRRILLILSAVLFASSSCASFATRSNTAVNAVPQMSDKNGALSGGDANAPIIAQNEPATINEITERKQAELGVSPNFATIDFKNFAYPVNLNKIIKLADGRFEYQEQPSGGGWYSFKHASFVDLTGDAQNEAIIRLSHVACGVSCDGGSDLFYIYSSGKDKPRLLWRFQTESLAYGGGLKSFIVKDKRIMIEQFGENGLTKFYVKNIKRSVYVYQRQKFVRESEELISMLERSVLNHEAELKIE